VTTPFLVIKDEIKIKRKETDFYFYHQKRRSGPRDEAYTTRSCACFSEVVENLDQKN